MELKRGADEGAPSHSERFEALRDATRARPQPRGMILIGNVVGRCPKDGGSLIVKSMANGARYASCINRPACNARFTLPAGVLTMTGVNCTRCETPVIKAGPRSLCLDGSCTALREVDVDDRQPWPVSKQQTKKSKDAQNEEDAIRILRQKSPLNNDSYIAHRTHLTKERVAQLREQVARDGGY